MTKFVRLCAYLSYFLYGTLQSLNHNIPLFFWPRPWLEPIRNVIVDRGQVKVHVMCFRECYDRDWHTSIIEFCAMLIRQWRIILEGIAAFLLEDLLPLVTLL